MTLISFAAPKTILAVAFALLIPLFSCSEDTLIGRGVENKPPEVWLSSGPVEGDTTRYQVHFYWGGWDPDGEIRNYEIVIVDGNPLGFHKEDTTGLDKWISTTKNDSVFMVTADDSITDVTIGGNRYTRYDATHTLFLRGVDKKGVRSWPAYRSFTAWSLAPCVIIESPRNPFPGQSQCLPTRIRFAWKVVDLDEIDATRTTHPRDSIRHLLVPYKDGILDEMNAHPEKFEKYATPWISREAPGDSGATTVIGDDELVVDPKVYVFAVQAMDEARAVTTIFDPKSNARVFYATASVGPLLRVSEPVFGTFSYVGRRTRPEVFEVPEGFVARFSWKADASTYGGEISSYRYGWDIIDVNDASEWAVEPSPYERSIPPTSFSSGIHTLFIEAVDDNGVSTIAQMEINVFPLEMNRNLLWVDDFYSSDFYQQEYASPTESEHKEFWLRICSRARGFSPTRDVYETALNNFALPHVEMLWKYKNIIWTYSSADAINTWDDMIRFIPESKIGKVSRQSFNVLAGFMTSGGHLWTEGRSERQGGLGAVLYPAAQLFPISLRCEITGPDIGCDGDTSGVNSMAYRDYCVNVIDKVVGYFRPDPLLPVRRIDWDAMHYAYRDSLDLVTVAHPGLPKKLTLWETVTRPGRFFDPATRGFSYLELYNPGYWMNLKGLEQQPCFHPMYRMRTRNVAVSAVNNATVAFWTTKYANVIAKVPGAVAAPSVQFGLPLWFFNRAQVDSIADVIFTEWQISAK